MIADYKLIKTDTIRELNRQVNIHIRKGWQLYGKPYVTSYYVFHYQAMIKTEGPYLDLAEKVKLLGSSINSVSISLKTLEEKVEELKCNK